MFDNPNVGVQYNESMLAKTAIMPTMKQRLNQAVQEAEKRLADCKCAQELFEKNPDLEELLNIMQRSHF